MEIAQYSHGIIGIEAPLQVWHRGGFTSLCNRNTHVIEGNELQAVDPFEGKLQRLFVGNGQAKLINRYLSMLTISDWKKMIRRIPYVCDFEGGSERWSNRWLMILFDSFRFGIEQVNKLDASYQYLSTNRQSFHLLVLFGRRENK